MIRCSADRVSSIPAEGRPTGAPYHSLDIEL
jgi:hypothetical protein